MLRLACFSTVAALLVLTAGATPGAAQVNLDGSSASTFEGGPSAERLFSSALRISDQGGSPLFTVRDEGLSPGLSTAGSLAASTAPVQGVTAVPMEDLSSVQVAPEPATMILMATGLLGVAYAARRRRRNKQES